MQLNDSINGLTNDMINDIIKTIKKEEIAIVVIDNTELSVPIQEAKRNDRESGEKPNNAVVIKAVDVENKTIDIFNPGFPELSKTYPLHIFIEAWNDSANYLVSISNQSYYTPHPHNLSGVKLEPELIELRDAIAENAHEVWAKTRKLEGWTYGPKRNDEKKIDPDMRPYQWLPESVKKDYRKMAISTIKLVKKLGWDLVKRKPEH